MKTSRRIPRSARSRTDIPRPPSGILRTKSLEESLCSASARDGRPTRRVYRNVSFDTTEIRTYPRVLDKSVDGPALSIGWKPVLTEFTTVQERDMDRYIATRGEMKPLKIEQRIDVLLDAGYCKKELVQHMVVGAKLRVAVPPSKPRAPKNNNMTNKLMKFANKLTLTAAA